MNPTLYAILINALGVCMNHQPDLRKPVFDPGYEQCAVVVPAAKKAEEDRLRPMEEAQERKDKADLAKAIAALQDLDRVAKTTAAKGNALLTSP